VMERTALLNAFDAEDGEWIGLATCPEPDFIDYLLTVSLDEDRSKEQRGLALREASRRQNPDRNVYLDDAISSRAQDIIINTKGQEVADQYLYGDRSPIVLLAPSQLKNRPTPRWLVHGVFRQATVGIFGGAPGLGKSFVMTALAGSVATGVPFLGHEVTQGKVLYVAGEGGSFFGKRLEAWEEANGVTIPEENFALIEAGVTMTDTASMNEVTELVRDGGFNLVIFDTLSALSVMESENDSAKIAGVLRSAEEVKRAHENVTVIVVHHVNKSAGTLRGASALDGNVDFVMLAKRHTKDDPESGFYLTSRGEDGAKVKDGEPVRIEGLSLASCGDSAVVVQSAPPRRDKAQEQADNAVLDYLSDGETHRTGDIKKAMKASGHSDATVDRSLTALSKSEQLVKPKHGYYQLPEGTK